jgi:hypothetical protein
VSVYAVPVDCDFSILQFLIAGNLPAGYVLNYDGQASMPPQSFEISPDLTPPQETVLNGLIEQARAQSGLTHLPNWATWSAGEAESFVHDNIFAGLDLAAVEAQIDAAPATIAGMKALLKQTAGAILSIRTILEALAQAVIFLRDLVLRWR